MHEGQRLKTERGSPQGGVISPLLANIYLHEVLDVWFEREVRPRLSGEAFLDFRRPVVGSGDKPATFDMLGFTHYWGKSRKGA